MSDTGTVIDFSQERALRRLPAGAGVQPASLMALPVSDNEMTKAELLRFMAVLKDLARNLSSTADFCRECQDACELGSIKDMQRELKRLAARELAQDI
ncbi:hypothetical protein GGE65_008391 [Skermanella aerolata]|uniref:hypothetical protein n=1 Tax=Skermanella aerolata TaxID=393310 RepID=UPI003D1F07EF